MVRTRIGIIYGCFSAIAGAALISTRYAACRRQFKTVKGSSEERKLLDYQTHMAVLGPHLAAQYIAMLTAHSLGEVIDKSDALIAEKGSFEMLEILHHLSSGFKAYWTDYAYNALDEMR